MQSEGYASYHPNSHGRRRFGRQRSRVITATVLFVGLFIGVLAGRWSISDVEEFIEEDPPPAQKDPPKTALDEFEGMYVLCSMYPPFEWLYKPRLHHIEIWFHQPWVKICIPPPQLPTKGRS